MKQSVEEFTGVLVGSNPCWTVELTASLPATHDLEAPYHITKDQDFPISLHAWVDKHEHDPAFKVCVLAWFLLHPGLLKSAVPSAFLWAP